MSETPARKISVSATESEFNHKSSKRRPSVGDTVARSHTDLGHQPIAHQPYHYMSRGRHADDILNVNVGGKKFTVRRTDLLADPRSRLADWFKPGATRPIATDKGGNIYLDRDAKIFRHILAYLRLKKERFAPSLALPSKPDDLAKLVGECDALNLVEFKELALEMLQKYQRTEEQHYVTSYVQMAMRDFESWQFEREQNQNAAGGFKKPKSIGMDNVENSASNSAYDEWETMH
ncbi:BTB/POZ domain-containing protein [Ditylenchus destructor]|nr:BTB/POZ domain-containing protein [Ditylenchus destructor]